MTYLFCANWRPDYTGDEPCDAFDTVIDHYGNFNSETTASCINHGREAHAYEHEEDYLDATNDAFYRAGFVSCDQCSNMFIDLAEHLNDAIPCHESYQRYSPNEHEAIGCCDENEGPNEIAPEPASRAQTSRTIWLTTTFP